MFRLSHGVREDRADLRLHRSTMTGGAYPQPFFNPFIQVSDSDGRLVRLPRGAPNAKCRPVVKV